MSEKRVILNSLPPADIYNPIAALPILKSFLKLNGYEVDVKYWQLLLNPIMPMTVNEQQIQESLTKLFPFYSLISDEYKDTDSKNRILSFLYGANPKYLDDIEYYDEFLSGLKKKILEIFDEELKKIDFNNVLIFGITSKFHQWIPGTILAKIVKEKYPYVKIVIGGFGSKDEAFEILETCRYFDFAIWGEGEYPLLELCNQLKEKKISYEKIPRLTYRVGNNINVSTVAKNNYLDFDNYIYPDYDEYINDFPYKEKITAIRLPINSIRSCLWKKCKFCNYNQGYKYRERSPESIIAEIEFMWKKYNINKFNFVDNDIYGTSIERFDKLLDLIIKSAKTNSAYDFWAQLIPYIELTSETIKKMNIAGLGTVFVGYEAITDSLLKKMNKSNSFSNNLFFVKWGLKYNVGSQVNIIRGVPDETTEDVLESIRNLHFLRFYLSVDGAKFVHFLGEFGLYKGADYYKFLSGKKEINEYNGNIFSHYLPESYLKDNLTFFSGIRKVLVNWKEWENFFFVERYYINNKYTYRVSENKGIVLYEEYRNNELLKTITFDEPDYIDALKLTNTQVCSFNYLFNKLSEKYEDFNERRLIEILANLKEAYLIYYDKNLKSIIAIIDIHLQ
jgi:radical SAM superfamily enzyme YgiQ (UPF0313 family)